MNTKTFNSPKKVDRKDREQARSEQLARQTRVLNILIDVMDLLSEYLAGSSYSLSMKDVSTHLNESGKYDVMDLKTASQYNYILIDLAKSHKNKFVAKDKIDEILDIASSDEKLLKAWEAMSTADDKTFNKKENAFWTRFDEICKPFKK